MAFEFASLTTLGAGFSEFFARMVPGLDLATFDMKDTVLDNERLVTVMPAVAVVSYLIMVFGGQRLMRDREAFDLKPLLTLWNAFLTALSVAMFFGLLPAVVGVTIENGLYESMCDRQGTRWTGPGFFWVYIFVLSKYAELIDTLFLVLRKKPVMLLHGWHHVSVLLMCWFLILNKATPGFFFALMNSAVHCFMYYYYTKAALGKPPRWGRYLTLGQISQMVVGIAITATWSSFVLRGMDCPSNNATRSMVISSLVYASYFVLFARFYAQRWAQKRSDRAAAAAAAAKEKKQ